MLLPAVWAGCSSPCSFAPERKCTLKWPECLILPPQVARVWDLQSQEEALETRVRQPEEDLRSRGSKADATPEFPTEDIGEAKDVPHPHVQPIVQQEVKHEQPLWPEGVADNNPTVTEFTTYTPYSPTEL